MFGLFKKTKEETAAALFIAACEFGTRLIHRNFLQLSEGSSTHTRFAMGSIIFGNLMCQHLVGRLGATSRVRTVEIGSLLTEKCIASLAGNILEPVRVADFVIWQSELEQFGSYTFDPPLERATFPTASLPLSDIVRELYILRNLRMASDEIDGLREQGTPSVAQLIPLARSLIMQTTGDEQQASSRQMIVDFVISFQVDWLSLHMSAQQALK